jgi:hypothetical protein
MISSRLDRETQVDASTKETVIIVHGTWAAPELGASRWYQPVYGTPSVGGFVGKLDDALGERGSPARCWAHCTFSIGPVKTIGLHAQTPRQL